MSTLIGAKKQLEKKTSEQQKCWNSIPKSSPHKRRASEISCSRDERATAKLKACDSDDVIMLNDEDHRSSNSK
ncbi:uncharacterized protein PGTG_20608 [Puccinia graminis f. sp. tritici CRL 75-36-700-3]|uniref:Uncharacterized protein n=1 Tax=Puccinia graminis f. sp. tritici (strain CRL 75-36-700-3 / race SCCL) TaxID=418459 RepID=H6QNU3_PUCGT|nr:uncharacterized protein PGTG_20608 [Puccinia graminis f. sp. tritici CRL 75-36-700-3]EHS62485.1 hypothetical protein PGTG_20608 [Puccinia graminis f. sp. tritici CRL 75-36-700-3]